MTENETISGSVGCTKEPARNKPAYAFQVADHVVCAHNIINSVKAIETCTIPPCILDTSTLFLF